MFESDLLIHMNRLFIVLHGVKIDTMQTEDVESHTEHYENCISPVSVSPLFWIID